MTKLLADLLTLSRFVLGGIVALLGFSLGEESLPILLTLVLVGWTTDVLDGPMARRAPNPPHTWLGDNEALADAALTVGTLIAFSFCGYFFPWPVAIYLLVCGALVFYTRSMALNMAFISIIHGLTLYVAFYYGGLWGWLVVAWIVLSLILDWRRFSGLVRVFFRGLADVSRKEEAGGEANENGSRAFLRN
jgi:cardiolipin synthase